MSAGSHEDLLTELGSTDSETARKEQLSAGSGVERVEPDGFWAALAIFRRSTILAAIDEEIAGWDDGADPNMGMVALRALRTRFTAEPEAHAAANPEVTP